MIKGVRTLADAPTPSFLALALVAAHVLECILKAYISREGNDTSLKKQEIRHNLNALWTLAHEQGLNIQQTPPDWVKILSHIHAAPYHLRYSTGINGISLPSAEPMTTELELLLCLVQESIRNSGSHAP
jgi:hypothetical protein